MNRGDRLFIPWLVLAGACSLLMWAFPGAETVPYHVAWIGIALAYGLEAWPWGRTLLAVVVFTILTGGILVVRAATGVIAWEELAEIPLMSVLVLLVVWNVRTRHVAYDTLSQIADRDRRRSAQRERLSRITSHEMRTPATIATGYVEMLISQEQDEDRRSDLRVIRDELGRLVLTSERLIRTIQVHDQDRLCEVHLDVFLNETAARWRVLADRDWVVTAERLRHLCSPERLRACLDTLLENAVRYTEPGDTVRIFGAAHQGVVMVGVADSGPGMDPVLAGALCRGEYGPWGSSQRYTAKDPKAQTGLGLALVWEAAAARGGRLVAGRAAEGGALVAMVVPRHLDRFRGNPRVARSATAGRLARLPVELGAVHREDEATPRVLRERPEPVGGGPVGDVFGSDR